ncbi:hypothetical protein ACFQX6_52025 [Streptosporangium lutulentum]
MAVQGGPPTGECTPGAGHEALPATACVRLRINGHGEYGGQPCRLSRAVSSAGGVDGASPGV